tara:strand:+ start:1990 stop:2250 length:261 start_codon:yes stop_codon:yes gene_type:complete
MNHLITSIPRIIIRNSRNLSIIDIQEKYTEKNPYPENTNNNYNQYYNSKQFTEQIKTVILPDIIKPCDHCTCETREDCYQLNIPLL